MPLRNGNLNQVETSLVKELLASMTCGNGSPRSFLPINELVRKSSVHDRSWGVSWSTSQY